MQPLLPTAVTLLIRVFGLAVSLASALPSLESLSWLGGFDATRRMLNVLASASPPSSSMAAVSPRLSPMVALLSSPSAREEGGRLSPQSLYPPVLLPCCHGLKVSFVSVFFHSKSLTMAAAGAIQRGLSLSPSLLPPSFPISRHWMIRRRGRGDNNGPLLSILPPSLSMAVMLPWLLPVVASLSSPLMKEEGSPTSPQLSYSPCCCPAATAQHLSLLPPLLPPRYPALLPDDPLRQQQGQQRAVVVRLAVDWQRHFAAMIATASPSKPFSRFQPPPSPLLLLPAPPLLLPS